MMLWYLYPKKFSTTYKLNVGTIDNYVNIRKKFGGTLWQFLFALVKQGNVSQL